MSRAAKSRIVAVVVVLAVLGALLWLSFRQRRVMRVEPKAIMGTSAELTVIVSGPAGEQRGGAVLAAGEAVLRNIEAKMSSHLESSEISRFNSAAVDVETPLSAESREVIRIACQFTGESGGAFDITVQPLLELWKRAGNDGKLPTQQQIEEARSRVGCQHIRLTLAGGVRLRAGVQVDLGGIAKKHAIDKAVEEMRLEPVIGGLVNVGGDIRVFGRPAKGETWSIGIRDPFAKDGLLGTMRIKDGAVCTSGNYERFVEIEGKRYSHIVDPRTGWTADAVPSVTVYGPTAVKAGLWATALVILGEDGMGRLPRDQGLEAMIVLGPADRIILDDDSVMNLEVRTTRLAPATLYSRMLAGRAAAA